MSVYIILFRIFGPVTIRLISKTTADSLAFYAEAALQNHPKELTLLARPGHRLHTLRYNILNKFEGFKIAPKTGGKVFNTSLTQHAAIHLTAYIVSSTCLYSGVIGFIIYLIKSKKKSKKEQKERFKQQFQFETLHAAQQQAQEALLKEVEQAKSNREVYLKDVKVAHKDILDQLGALTKRLGLLEEKVLRREEQLQ